MHPMFLPVNAYCLEDAKLNRQRIEQLCRQFQFAKNGNDVWLLGQKAYWMLCAFHHGCREQYEEAETLIRAAQDEAEERVGAA